MNHPHPDLSAYLDGELPLADLRDWQRRLAHEPDLQRDADSLLAVARAVRDLPRLQAPDDLTDRILGRVFESPRTSQSDDSSPDHLSTDDEVDVSEVAVSEVAVSEVDVSEVEVLLHDLPRLQPPPNLTARIMASLPEPAEAPPEPAEAPAEASLAPITRISWLRHLATAAGLLLVASAGVFLTTPAAHAPRLAYDAKPSAPAPPAQRAATPEASFDAAPEPPPPLSRDGFDASVELMVPSEQLPAVTGSLRAAIDHLGFLDAERVTDESYTLSVNVPAHHTDELLSELAVLALPLSPQDREVLERAHSELDTIVLTNGFAFTGHAQRVPGGWTLTLGEQTWRFDDASIRRVERASERRRLRLELRRDP